MVTYLAPGVYVEEVSGLWDSPISGPSVVSEPTFDWSDATKWQAEQRAAFVGFAETGPFNRPVLVHSARAFAETFGGDSFGGFTASAVDGYFGNGGEACYVVRLGDARSQASHDLSPALVRESSRGTGLGALEGIKDIGFIAVPDLWKAHELGQVDLDAARAVQLAMIAHAEQMGDRIALIDPPPNLSAEQVRDWRVDVVGYDSMFAALYYPWIRTTRRSTGEVQMFPPSGHVAGVIARCDREQGVHLPPANAVVRQALDLGVHTTAREREVLNPVGINALVRLPGSGIVVYGARTLSSDPDWRYLHRRRVVNSIASAIRSGTHWALFRLSPTSVEGWDVSQRLVTEISEYLYLQWLGGVLEGDAPDEAFVVRCDEYTSPPEVRDAGQLCVEIGLSLGSSVVSLKVVYFAP